MTSGGFVEKDSAKKTLLENRIQDAFKALKNAATSGKGGGESAPYLNARARLADYVFRYARLVWGYLAENAAVEIMVWIERTASSYKEDNGDFMHYLCASLKKEITRANEKNAVFEARNGVSKTKNKRYTRCVERYVRAKGGEDEEIDLLNTVSDVRTAADKSIMDEEELRGAEEKLRRVEEVFDNEAQEREGKGTKEYLGALLTRLILKDLKGVKSLTSNDLEKLLGARHFCDREMLKEYLASGKLPKQGEVAARFGRGKTDAARTIKRFGEKCKKCQRLAR